MGKKFPALHLAGSSLFLIEAALYDMSCGVAADDQSFLFLLLFSLYIIHSPRLCKRLERVFTHGHKTRLMIRSHQKSPALIYTLSLN